MKHYLPSTSPKKALSSSNPRLLTPFMYDPLLQCKIWNTYNSDGFDKGKGSFVVRIEQTEVGH